MPYYLDVGTGESDLTWQIMGGIGYSYQWGDIVATWRYLDWNNKPDKALQGLNLNGPLCSPVRRRVRWSALHGSVPGRAAGGAEVPGATDGRGRILRRADDQRPVSLLCVR